METMVMLPKNGEFCQNGRYPAKGYTALPYAEIEAPNHLLKGFIPHNVSSVMPKKPVMAGSSVVNVSLEKTTTGTPDKAYLSIGYSASYRAESSLSKVFAITRAVAGPVELVSS